MAKTRLEGYCATILRDATSPSSVAPQDERISLMSSRSSFQMGWLEAKNIA